MFETPLGVRRRVLGFDLGKCRGSTTSLPLTLIQAKPQQTYHFHIDLNELQLRHTHLRQPQTSKHPISNMRLSTRIRASGMPRSDPQAETPTSSTTSTLRKLAKKIKAKGASMTRKMLTQSKPKQVGPEVRWKSTPYELQTSKKATLPRVEEEVLRRPLKLRRWAKKAYPSHPAMVIDLVADEVSTSLAYLYVVTHPSNSACISRR